MVNHGLGVLQSALSNQAPPSPLDPKFDAQATWVLLQTDYLNCTDANAGAAQAPPAAAPAVTPDGWPIPPEKRLASIKALPAKALGIKLKPKAV